MRADKKKEIKAPLPADLREVLGVRARAAGLSPMAYCCRLAVAAVHSEKVIRALAPYFKRGYIPRYAPHTAMMGRVIAPSLEALLPEGLNFSRMPVKLYADEHLAVCEVSYALATSHSKALSVLLSEALIQQVEIDTEREELAN